MLNIKIFSSVSYDLSGLLQFGNLLIGIVTPIMYIYSGPTKFINFYTVLLASVFSLQNILMLYYEKKHRDPFILILILVTTLFYLTRTITLLYDPHPHFSSALLRYKLNAKDINYSLFFIALSNISIFMGLISVGGKIVFRKLDNINFKHSNPLTVSLILMLTYFCNFFFILGVESLGRISTFIAGIFLSTSIMLLLSLIYTLLNYKYLSIIYKFVLILLFGVFLVISTLFGSRSSFLTLLILIFCAILSLKGVVKISRRILITSFLLIPVLIISFLIATYVRRLQYDTKTVINIKRIEFLKDFHLSKILKDEKVMLSPIFDRIGYLGYASDMITNGKEYRKVINFKYYFKSIIDNGLTPGFNVFDTPKASNALRYIYFKLKANPTQKDIMANYNSDMFTVYGEYYALFGGYPALIFLFIFSYFFKRIYIKIKTQNIFLFYLYRGLILLVFYNWLISFGMDWMLIELIGYLIPIFIWWKSFSMVKRKQISAETLA